MDLMESIMDEDLFYMPQKNIEQTNLKLPIQIKSSESIYSSHKDKEKDKEKEKEKDREKENERDKSFKFECDKKVKITDDHFEIVNDVKIMDYNLYFAENNFKNVVLKYENYMIPKRIEMTRNKMILDLIINPNLLKDEGPLFLQLESQRNIGSLKKSFFKDLKFDNKKRVDNKKKSILGRLNLQNIKKKIKIKFFKN